MTPSDGTPPPQAFMAASHPTLPFTVASVPNTTFFSRTSTASWRVDRYPARHTGTVLITDGGTSDVLAGKTGGQMFSDLGTYVAGRRAQGYDTVYGLTLTPSAIFTTAEEDERVAYNAALVADPAAAGLDGVIDIAAASEFADPNNATYFADTTGHYTQAAANVIAGMLTAAGI